jgi:hypothetical protein
MASAHFHGDRSRSLPEGPECTPVAGLLGARMANEVKNGWNVGSDPGKIARGVEKV